VFSYLQEKEKTHSPITLLSHPINLGRLKTMEDETNKNKPTENFAQKVSAFFKNIFFIE
jgi:hypothetical protein